MTAAGLLAALSILLGYVEYLIPVVPPIAGIKLGLGNIAVLVAMVMLRSDGMAAGIMITKVIMTEKCVLGEEPPTIIRGETPRSTEPASA